MSEWRPSLDHTVAEWVQHLAHACIDARASFDDGEIINALGELERLKSAAAAAQARLTEAFDRSQRDAQRGAGLPERRVGRGVASQVALARRDSAAHGGRHLGLARALVREMPQTLLALEVGDITEWRATLVARETACLSREDRTAVDAALANRPGGLGSLGDRETEGEARRIAYRLDPGSVTARRSRAESERRVTIRPAPDTMALVTGLLPAAQGVAVIASLTRQADSRLSAGDPRSRAQIMADTLVERVTGQATAGAVAVEVQLVMTDTALMHDHDAPAQLAGYGPLPASAVRSWLNELPDEVSAWLRRLYVEPSTHQLVAMDSRRRCFAGNLRRFVVARDQVCRTPWCSAPIRHVDHTTRFADDGATTADNAQGLCQACNLAKEAPGWRSRSRPDGSIETCTPTGHSYTSHPPALPGSTDRATPASRVEFAFAQLTLIA